MFTFLNLLCDRERWLHWEDLHVFGINEKEKFASLNCLSCLVDQKYAQLKPTHQSYDALHKVCVVRHEIQDAARVWIFLITASSFYLLSLFLSSPLFLTVLHKEVRVSVHPRPGITNLKGRLSRLRTAGEELYRPTLFSASCCGPPPTLSFYHAFPLSVFPPSSIYYTHSKCQVPGPRNSRWPSAIDQVRLL